MQPLRASSYPATVAIPPVWVTSDAGPIILSTMSWFVRATGVLACLLALSGCARPGPAPDGSLRLADAVDIRTLDTAIGYDASSWRFERLINDGLLNFAPTDSTLVPAVAEALPEIEEGRRFTFRLRDNVYFHHGRQVVAEDFRYSLTRILDPQTASPGRSLYEGIVGARAFGKGEAGTVAGLQCPDELTFVVELESPDLAFLNLMALPFAYAVPREEVERYSASDWPRHAVGCGPYRLDVWEPGVRIRVGRFDRYYDPSRGILPAIEMRFGVADYLQLMMFERGEIDVTGVPLTDLERIDGDARLKSYMRTSADLTTAYASFNTEQSPFDNRAVRQAFNYALNRDRLVQLYAGTIRAARGVLPPGMPGYNPDLRSYTHDPAKARELLASAGFRDNLQVELTTRDRPAERRLGEAIQSDLRDVGVSVAVRAVSFPVWLELVNRHEGLPFTINNWIADYPDPSNFLDVLLNGRHVEYAGSSNRSFYNNPQVNDLLDRAAVMTDAAARLKLYQAAEQIIVDDAPWLFLYHPTRMVLVQPWLQNYHLHPVWTSREDLIWIEEVAQ